WTGWLTGTIIRFEVALGFTRSETSAFHDVDVASRLRAATWSQLGAGPLAHGPGLSAVHGWAVVHTCRLARSLDTEVPSASVSVTRRSLPSPTDTAMAASLTGPLGPFATWKP